MIYRCEFYRNINKKLPEKVYYEDQYFITVAASQVSCFCLLNQFLEIYRVGDQNQSVSNKSQVARLSHEKTVIRAVLKTHDETRTPTGMEYWYVRTSSWVSTFFITAFLRHTNRRIGRIEACKFWKEVRASYPDVAKRVKRRYYLLAAMHVLHMSDKFLETAFHLRK